MMMDCSSRPMQAKRKAIRQFPRSIRFSNSLGCNEAPNDVTTPDYLDDFVLEKPSKMYPPWHFAKRDFPLHFGGQNSHSISEDTNFITNGKENDPYFGSHDHVLDGHVKRDAYLIFKDIASMEEKFGADCLAYRSMLSGDIDYRGEALGPSHREVKKVIRLYKLGADCEAHRFVLSGDIDYGGEELGPRSKVKMVMRLYHEILDKLLLEKKKVGMPKPGIYRDAAIELRKSCDWLNTRKTIGSIPGVEIGDEFQFRAELCIVGLHHQFIRGIDYLDKDGTKLAISVVATNRYANDMNSPDVLTYVGEGGNPMVRNQGPLKDQVLNKGNLALKNSMERKIPIRVIRSEKIHAFKGSQRKALHTTYVYDGLYLVEKCLQERGEFGKLVFKFELRRIVGQPQPTKRFVSKLNKNTFCNKGVFRNRISKGEEKRPIALVSTLGDEGSLPVNCVTNVTNLALSDQLDGCDCVDGCSDSEDCSCKIKNGLAFPYDYSEHLIRKKTRIYECGPSCKCFDSCINRVSQRGIRFQLEVFMTESKGCGVRSNDHIPLGSFLCEYVEEDFQSKEGKYKVDGGYVSPFHLDCSKQDGVSINATQFGNVGKYINHSCLPNLDIQNVFYDNSRKSRMMLFAIKDIPPLQELTYDYNKLRGTHFKK